MKKKNNYYILNKIGAFLKKKLKKEKVKNIGFCIEGVGPGKYSLIYYLNRNFKIKFVFDKTSMPFNGCRPKKKKRR